MEKKEKREISKGSKRDFPPASFGIAEEVLKAVNEAGGKINTKILEGALNTKGGALARKIAAARRWGLVMGTGTLIITDIGKRILHPISQEELIKTKKEAFLNIPLFADLYKRFGLKLPPDTIFKAILVREFNLTERDSKIILGIYKDSIKNFLSLISEEEPEKRDEEKISEKDTFDEGINIIVHSHMGKNKFKAKTKSEFQKLRKDLDKIWDAIEHFWKEEHIHEKQEEDET